MASLARTVLKASPAIDLLPPSCDSVKVKKVKSEVIPFWSFIFPETYMLYIMYIPLSPKGEFPLRNSTRGPFGLSALFYLGLLRFFFTPL